MNAIQLEWNKKKKKREYFARNGDAYAAKRKRKIADAHRDQQRNRGEIRMAFCQGNCIITRTIAVNEHEFIEADK